MSKFQILKTQTGRTLEVRSNESRRTFTIKDDGTKYRTYPMAKVEFNEATYRTGNDWSHYLRNSNNYYIVK